MKKRENSAVSTAALNCMPVPTLSCIFISRFFPLFLHPGRQGENIMLCLPSSGPLDVTTPCWTAANSLGCVAQGFNRLWLNLTYLNGPCFLIPSRLPTVCVCRLRVCYLMKRRAVTLITLLSIPVVGEVHVCCFSEYS